MVQLVGRGVRCWLLESGIHVTSVAAAQAYTRWEDSRAAALATHEGDKVQARQEHDANVERLRAEWQAKKEEVGREGPVGKLIDCSVVYQSIQGRRILDASYVASPETCYGMWLCRTPTPDGRAERRAACRGREDARGAGGGGEGGQPTAQGGARGAAAAAQGGGGCQPQQDGASPDR